MTIQTSTPIKRFFALDALRGVAALGIVVWHYRHFAEGGRPFEKLLLFFHVSGLLMVDLFFCLSGFIFFWKYSEAIIEKSISFNKFFWLRLTRLYPLHFVTLILAAVGQYYIFTANDNFFIYQDQDLKHFLLNILFISNWGFENGLSFNIPIASVSIEILLYLLFYFYMSGLKTKSLVGPIVLAFLGWQLFFFDINLYIFNKSLGRGLISFFAGGLTYQIFKIITACHREKLRVGFGIAGLVSLSFWLWNLWLTYTVAHDMSVYIGMYYWSAFIGFPSTVLFLALLDHKGVFVVAFKKLAFLGDISYSVYLLHFPIQLVFIAISLAFPIDFSKVWIFLLYVSVTVALSVASHKWLEIPCQRYLRSKFSFPGKARPAKRRS